MHDTSQDVTEAPTPVDPGYEDSAFAIVSDPISVFGDSSAFGNSSAFGDSSSAPALAADSPADSAPDGNSLDVDVVVTFEPAFDAADAAQSSASEAVISPPPSTLPPTTATAATTDVRQSFTASASALATAASSMPPATASIALFTGVGLLGLVAAGTSGNNRSGSGENLPSAAAAAAPLVPVVAKDVSAGHLLPCNLY